MNFKDFLLPDSDLAMVHGGMPPRTAPGGGAVGHAASEAYSRGAHHNAKLFASIPAYRKAVAVGTMAVVSPQAAAQCVAKAIVRATHGKK